MNQQRANEVYAAHLASGTSEIDRRPLRTFLTSEEDKTVVVKWQTLPGSSCWMDAFFSFMTPTALPPYQRFKIANPDHPELKERFAEEYGLRLPQVNNLCTAAELAKSAQERYHNASPVTYEREGRKADQKIKLFEALAKVLGFDGVDWPGLYPNLRKGERRWIALPLD